MQAKPDDGPGAWVDPDDAPELKADWFAQADLYHGEKLISRGHPPIGKAKQLVTLRLAPDVLARLRASGPGWQTRPAEAIRRLVTARLARRRGSAPEQTSPAHLPHRRKPRRSCLGTVGDRLPTVARSDIQPGKPGNSMSR